MRSPFDVGTSERLTVPTRAHAYLFLAENDGEFHDNSGAFTVAVTVR